MTEDLSRMNRAKILRDKKMYDAKGTWRWVPYKQWEREVVNNPTGPTAFRAKLEKDSDLDRIQIPIIQVGFSDAKREDLEVGPIGEAKETKNKESLIRSVSSELARRLGFRSAEDGKGSDQKKGVKDGEKETTGNSKGSDA